MYGHEFRRLPGKGAVFLRLLNGLTDALHFHGLGFSERTGVVGHSISELDKVVDVDCPPNIYSGRHVAVGVHSRLDERTVGRLFVPLMSCVGPHHRPLQSVFGTVSVELVEFSKIIHLRDDHGL